MRYTIKDLWNGTMVLGRRHHVSDRSRFIMKARGGFGGIIAFTLVHISHILLLTYHRPAVLIAHIPTFPRGDVPTSQRFQVLPRPHIHVGLAKGSPPPNAPTFHLLRGY